MNCHATRAILDLRAESRLSAGRMKSVDAHLAGCDACRALSAPLAPAPAPAAGSAFKNRLAAAMKSERKSPKAEPARTLPLWPRDLGGTLSAAAALVFVAAAIGWSGYASQSGLEGGELAAGRTP